MSLRVSKDFFLGGQAVIEGVVIRTRRKVALAIRSRDGLIKVKSWLVRPYSEINPVLGFPVIRGVVSLYDALVWGIKTLCYSANEVLEGERKISLWEMISSIVLAMGLAIGLFVILPTLLSHVIGLKVGLGRIFLNLFEGLLRVVIFIGYLIVISLSKEIREVFSYHGAEHKTINAYENLKSELTPEIVQSFSRFHYRCGTSFILFVLVISIFSFALFEQEEIFRRLVVRIALIPLIAGVSYEILRLSFSSKVARLLARPGLWLQYLTTREPTREQIEVGIVALKEALGDVGEVKEA